MYEWFDYGNVVTIMTECLKEQVCYNSYFPKKLIEGVVLRFRRLEFNKALIRVVFD